MDFNFIWIGSVPHDELLEKIVNKARYFAALFNMEKNNFYLWTTNNLINSINNRIFRFSTSYVKLEAKSIESLFPYNGILKGKVESRDETLYLRDLHKIFLSENHGALRTHAFAADLIKYFLLHEFKGMYIDAGLELHYKKMGNVLTTSKGFIYKPGNFTKNYKNYDYGYVQLSNQYDIQILYSSLSNKAKNFFFNILFNCNKHFKENFSNFFSYERYWRLYPLSSKSSPPEVIYWTGAQFIFATEINDRIHEGKVNIVNFIKNTEKTISLKRDVNNNSLSRKRKLPNLSLDIPSPVTQISVNSNKDNVYLFNTAYNAEGREYFLDFPSVSIKDKTKQKFENYRNRRTVTMEL